MAHHQCMMLHIVYPRKQKRTKVKTPATASQEDDKECHRTLQSHNSYHAKVKALKYLEFTQDTIWYQKVTEKLSAPKIKHHTTRLMQEAPDMHDSGCQGVLRELHYDGMWYRRVGTWLHYMEKTYQKWLHHTHPPEMATVHSPHTRNLPHFDTAKQDALTFYMDSATAVGLHTRYRRHLHRLQEYIGGWAIHNRYTTTQST